MLLPAAAAATAARVERCSLVAQLPPPPQPGEVLWSVPGPSTAGHGVLQVRCPGSAVPVATTSSAKPL
jgi:hypothetical protein